MREYDDGTVVVGWHELADDRSVVRSLAVTHPYAVEAELASDGKGLALGMRGQVALFDDLGRLGHAVGGWLAGRYSEMGKTVLYGGQPREWGTHGGLRDASLVSEELATYMTAKAITSRAGHGSAVEYLGAADGSSYSGSPEAAERVARFLLGGTEDVSRGTYDVVGVALGLWERDSARSGKAYYEGTVPSERTVRLVDNELLVEVGWRMDAYKPQLEAWRVECRVREDGLQDEGTESRVRDVLEGMAAPYTMSLAGPRDGWSAGRACLVTEHVTDAMELVDRVVSGSGLVGQVVCDPTYGDQARPPLEAADDRIERFDRQNPGLRAWKAGARLAYGMLAEEVGVPRTWAESVRDHGADRMARYALASSHIVGLSRGIARDGNRLPVIGSKPGLSHEVDPRKIAGAIVDWSVSKADEDMRMVSEGKRVALRHDACKSPSASDVIGSVAGKEEGGDCRAQGRGGQQR